MSNPPPPPGSGSGPLSDNTQPAGFFASLFDFSFNSFVTPTIVRIVYAIFTVLMGVWLLIFIALGFDAGGATGIAAAISGPIMAVVLLAFFRMMLEMYYAIVRMSEDIHRNNGRL